MTHLWYYHECINNPFTLPDVTEHKKYIDRVADSTLQLTFEKPPLVEFWCSIGEYPQLLKRLLKYSLSDYISVCMSGFSSRTSTKNTIFQQIEYRCR